MCEWLSAAELRELTGLEQRAAIKRWLRLRGIYFVEDARGRPIVGRAHLRLLLGGGKAPAQTLAHGPNLSAVA